MSETLTLDLAGIVRESIVDGPGIRFVVFCQGCPHNCEGCHNPATHEFGAGKETPVERILVDLRKNPLYSCLFAGPEFVGGRIVAALTVVRAALAEHDEPDPGAVDDGLADYPGQIQSQCFTHCRTLPSASVRTMVGSTTSCLTRSASSARLPSFQWLMSPTR